MLPITRTQVSIAASLTLGAMCIALTFYCHKGAVGSDLFAQLVFSGDEGGRLAVKFTNIGRRELILNTCCMSYALMPEPGNPSSYLVYIHGGGDELHPASGTVLPAGESTEIGNILPLVRTLPRGDVFLSALYQASRKDDAEGLFWHGTIRSFPLMVELTGE